MKPNPPNKWSINALRRTKKNYDIYPCIFVKLKNCLPLNQMFV